MSETIDWAGSIPVLRDTEVLVIGGGPAGIGAALAARRCGRKVVLIEESGQLGGATTLMNVSMFVPVGSITGLHKEIVEEFCPEALERLDHTKRAVRLNPFRYRFYIQEKLLQAGVEILFHTSFSAVHGAAGKPEAVVASTREGLRAIRAGLFVDCTGDGTVAVAAGARVRMGREEDGLTQPMTMMFMMQDTGKRVEPVLPAGCPEYRSKEDLPRGHVCCWKDVDAGLALFNMTRTMGNGADVEELSRAEHETLRQVLSVVHFLQRNGFETYALSHVASRVGVRETRRIVGEYTLTQEDIKAQRSFEDVVAQTNAGVDIHNPAGDKSTERWEQYHYDIPYRCLVPKGVERMLVPGRAISTDHVAMSSVRMQPTCLNMGQAAGIAASLGIERSCPVRDVPYTDLRRELERGGTVFLKPSG